MRTRELINLPNSGHAGINALFSKAHSAGWDIDRDVDWTLPVRGRRFAGRSQLGGVRLDADLPRPARARCRRYATRRALGRMLNVLQVGESVAQDVCAKLGLRLREEDYRNHAAAQAMDEARHHLAYRRFLEKMNEDAGGHRRRHRDDVRLAARRRRRRSSWSPPSSSSSRAWRWTSSTASATTRPTRCCASC